MNHGTRNSVITRTQRSKQPANSERPSASASGSESFPPPATYRWAATFAYITASGTVITGTYFEDPSTGSVTRLMSGAEQQQVAPAETDAPEIGEHSLDHETGENSQIGA